MAGLDWIGGEATLGWIVLLLALAAAGAAMFIEWTRPKPKDPAPGVLQEGEIVRLESSGRLVETRPRSRRYRVAKPDR